MIKKFLVQALFTAVFTQPAFAVSILNFNGRTIENAIVQSIEENDFYVVAANSEQGSFTISDLTVTESGRKDFSFSFEVETENRSYKYLSKATDENTSCKKSLKLSSVKFGKILSQETTNGNSFAGIDPQ